MGPSSTSPVVLPSASYQADRRRSLPSPSSKGTRSASGNRVHVKPADPEVISSLISSLSSISPAAANHFENHPASASHSFSTPSSPSAFQSTFDRQTKHGATTTPTLRTTKSPSALSPLSAGADAWGHQRNSFHPPSPRWKDQDDCGSIGSVSIEPGDIPRRNSTASRDSAGSDLRKGWRGHMGLMYMSSKERLRDKETDRKRLSEGIEGLGLEIPDARGMPSSTAGTGTILAETTISEEPSISASAMPPLPFASASAGNSPKVGGGSPLVRTRESSPGPSVGGRPIPSRESSLRRTSNSHTNPKRRSYRSSTQEPVLGSSDGTKEQGQIERSQSEGLVSEAGGRKRDVPEGDRKARSPSTATNGTFRRSFSTLNYPFGGPPRPALGDASLKSEKGTLADERASVKDEEESAPSPSIVQRRPRETTVRITSFSSVSSGQRRASPSKPNVDVQPEMPPTMPSRRNSRLQKKMRSSSPKAEDRHTRTFSNPLNRKSEVFVGGRAPKIVVEDRPASADSIEDSIVSYLSASRLSQKVNNPQTGRVISFSEVGDPEGFAVFCCVGMGLTRYIMAFYDELATTLKLRLITPDRPGVGESEAYADGTGTPLSWPGKRLRHIRARIRLQLTVPTDDVYAICQSLKITKFSILAHSAGAIYALATALRMPQHIRGRIHLLAPWIPPSQLSVIGAPEDSPRAGSVPYSQKLLRVLPTPFLKAANSSFMNATSSKITSSLPRSPRSKKKCPRRTRERSGSPPKDGGPVTDGRNSLMFPRPDGDADSPLTKSRSNIDEHSGNGVGTAKTAAAAAEAAAATTLLAEKERQSTYDDMLTRAVWDLATTGANPAVDLLVCLERRQTIGFRYVDINRAVVIHHGSRDTRVPVENVRWLGKTMRRCEVRVLEGEGHSLMASATVMGNVLMEVAKEWEDWTKVVQQGRVRS
ncbi:MAG: hypothetical protein M1825_004145 [Sarcosagium campestre]|nr:MAG: hypothetical protein M1825_004145 [Sarcosagium campestre]